MSFARLLLPGLVLALASVSGSYAQTVSIVSGQGQVACLGFCLDRQTFDPLVVRVTDAAGRPVANATVTWAVINGTYSGISATQSQTDATGQTSVNYTSSYFFSGQFQTLVPFLQGQVTATVGSSSVTFTETQALASGSNLAPLAIGVPTGQQITGQAGQIATTPIAISVSTTAGPVFGVAVELVPDADNVTYPATAVCQSVAGNPSGVVLTDASGVANCYPQFGAKVGIGRFTVKVGSGYKSLGPLDFTVSVGPPGLITVLRGDNQQATLSGTNLPAPLVAVVGDLGGNPVGGADVSWSVIPSSAATLFNQRTSSANDGQVSTNVRIAAASGPFQVRVTLNSNPAVGATFTVQAPSVVISGLSKVSGDGQSAGQGTAFGSPLTVQAVANGAPAANIPISFTVNSGSATLSAASAVTNSQGQASVNVTAGQTVGTVVITAAAGSQSVQFNLTVAPPGPTLTSDSFLNGASFQKDGGQTGGISPCSIATIQAPGIAPGVQGVVAPAVSFAALPYLLAGVQVSFGNSAAPIYNVQNVNGTQSVTVQVPCDIAAGNTQVTVTVSGSAKTATAVVKAASPGIFETVQSDNVKRAVLVRVDGSFVGPNNPARRGEQVRMYATGVGAVNPPVATNAIPIAGTDATVLGTPIVGVNNGGVQVVSARLAPGLIGVAEVVFVVPSDAPAGDLKLSLAINPANGGQTQFSQGSTIPVL